MISGFSLALLLLTTSAVNVSNVHAQFLNLCSNDGTGLVSNVFSSPTGVSFVDGQHTQASITATNLTGSYRLEPKEPFQKYAGWFNLDSYTATANNNNEVTFSISDNDYFSHRESREGDEKRIVLELVNTSNNYRCTLIDYTILPQDAAISCDATLSALDGRSGCFDTEQDLLLNIRNVRNTLTSQPYNGKVHIDLEGEGGDCFGVPFLGGVIGTVVGNGADIDIVNGSAEVEIAGCNINNDNVNNTFWVSIKYESNHNQEICGDRLEVPIEPSCTPEERDRRPVTGSSTTQSPSDFNADAFGLCKQLVDGSPQHSDCLACHGGSGKFAGITKGVWTAVGCISTDPTQGFASLVKLGLWIAGGVALLMILASGFILSTSQGDPKRTGEAKDMLQAAVIGLFFIIFSVTVLQFVGVNILQIPGFGGS